MSACAVTLHLQIYAAFDKQTELKKNPKKTTEKKRRARLLALESEVPADPSVSTRVLTRYLFRVCVCFGCGVHVRVPVPPARLL